MRDLTNYMPRTRPGGTVLKGQTVRLEPAAWHQHGAALAPHIAGPANAGLWTYIPFGPPANADELVSYMQQAQRAAGWETMVLVRVSDNQAVGMASYMRIREDHGSAEVGCVIFGEALKQTREATEAMYLMARHVFDELGYRRYEWKCDNKNAASKRAAERFGFVFEGLFRNDLVVKGRNRDTAWYSIIEEEWPRIRAGFEAWLDNSNFDAQGRQRTSLAACRVKAR